jgi:hypothetical protein
MVKWRLSYQQAKLVNTALAALAVFFHHPFPANSVVTPQYEQPAGQRNPPERAQYSTASAQDMRAAAAVMIAQAASAGRIIQAEMPHPSHVPPQPQIVAGVVDDLAIRRNAAPLVVSNALPPTMPTAPQPQLFAGVPLKQT